ncbi:hypothetical protein E4Z66_06460 [Aliishimia ponticola]|uniref:Uncharacterized protein n=1 Tax=Aliishimia ponticola TaxID=2499833 RepID=A0A4S4NEN9_9RHOB|nr:hypothetical protein [Aliishimia ponticola]THH36588.1 hypothetical protein E4Z66_06460 [Aliishimia ponticola]
MSNLQVATTKIQQGVWRGVLTHATGVPQIEVLHLDKPVPLVTVEEVEDGWLVQFPIPADAIADGVQTFVVVDKVDGEQIWDFTLIAGEALGDDIRAEIDLLRAELDMLKRAFRRHCLETA